MTDHPTKKRRTDSRSVPTEKPSRPDPPDAESITSESGTAPALSKKDKKGLAAADEFDLDAASDASDEYDNVSGSDAEAEDEFLNSDQDSDDSLDSVLAAQNNSTKKRKRNDPDVFATSMSKILNSHLTTKARSDPVLVRSKSKAQVIDESKLETKARRVLKEQKRLELEKGRVRDILPKGDGMEVVRAVERERQLRKIAQRGVVRMFNAVRATQIKSEQAQVEVRKKGVIGLGNRGQKVTEMSKQGFLDLIQSSSARA